MGRIEGRRLRWHGGVVVLVAVTTLAAACSKGSSDATATTTKVAEATPTTADPNTTKTSADVPEAPAPAAPAWKPCTAIAKTAQCATLVVPLDYTHPTDGTIDLAISRIPATSSEPHLGALIFNPGGPGGTGMDLPASLSEDAAGRPADAAMLARFDLIGFDPRGVGQSTPIDCGDRTALDRADYSPESPVEVAELKSTMKAFAAACKAKSGRLLPFVGTDEAARDVDQIRRALDQKTLSLFGFSYGTSLFGTYIDLFPTHVRAAVLDGDIPSGISGLASFAEQARSLDEQFDVFLAACAARTDCPLTPLGFTATSFDDLIKRWDAKPPTLPDGPAPTASEAVTVAATALYSTTYRRFLEVGLSDAVHGDAKDVETGWELYSGGNSNESGIAVNCADYRWPAPKELFAAVTKLERDHPRMGEAFIREFLPCAYWPQEGRAERVHHATGAPTVLLVGTTGDPATPYAWSKRMARELDNAVLLTRDGVGHTAWDDSGCIDDAIDAYLLTTKPPPAGTRCPSDP